MKRLLSTQLTIGSLFRVAVLVSIVLALGVRDAQAQAPAPNGSLTIGTVTVTRTDGPQIQLNDTRFPTNCAAGQNCPAASLRGASTNASTGMIIAEHAGSPGSMYYVAQPVGDTSGSFATGFLAYGQGGIGATACSNVNAAFVPQSPVSASYYIVGTSTCGGTSLYFPVSFWNMNHVAIRLDRDAAGKDIIQVNHPPMFDDAEAATVADPSSRISLGRVLKANADHGGLSWPIEWFAPTFDGQSQMVNVIKEQGFGADTGGVNAAYGVGYFDKATGRLLFSVRNDGVRLGGPAAIPVQAEPAAVTGGIQIFTKDNGTGLLSLCAKFPSGQVKCFVMQD